MAIVLHSALSSESDHFTWPALFLVGPTAIGKTAAAIEIVRQLGGDAEIVSADSVQVYRGLDIGSAKPSRQERGAARIHLIDIVDPDEEFTLSDFQAGALAAVRETRERGRLALVAGGAGLYIRALTRPLGLPHVPPDEPRRAAWRALEAANGEGALHQELARRDPETAQRLHANDLKRLIRALEVLEHTGRTLSYWHSRDREQGSALLPGARIVGLNCERTRLYGMIDSRVDAMIDAGFVDEVAALRARGYDKMLRPMQSLGYKEINSYFDGEATLPETVERIKLRTRQFARRQMIWFRADERIQWIDCEGKSAATVAAEALETASPRPADRAGIH